MITAKIIADSIGPNGYRITSFVLNFPRIVLAEFNTHRMFSRNSASSRAIPFEKMSKMVQETPFIPLRFQKDHKGMQGSEYLEGDDHDEAVKAWLASRNDALERATYLNKKVGVTKQLANRLLEPYMYHKVIVTSSDYENFFALRAHPEAEIHIADVAEKMLVAYNESIPVRLEAGQWHIPFGDKFDDDRIYKLLMETTGIVSDDEIEMVKVKIATARCARVSYNDFDGEDNYAKDLALHDRLHKSGHFSPFEHCAQATFQHSYSGNIFGFKQYRKMLAGECKQDPRVIQWPR